MSRPFFSSLLSLVFGFHRHPLLNQASQRLVQFFPQEAPFQSQELARMRYALGSSLLFFCDNKAFSTGRILPPLSGFQTFPVKLLGETLSAQSCPLSDVIDPHNFLGLVPLLSESSSPFTARLPLPLSDFPIVK